MMLFLSCVPMLVMQKFIILLFESESMEKFDFCALQLNMKLKIYHKKQEGCKSTWVVQDNIK